MKSTSICVLVGLSLIISAAITAADADYDRAVIYDIPQHVLMEKYGRMPGQKLLAEDLADLASSYFTGDTLKLLVILLEWSDRPGTYSRETIDSVIFSRDAWATGSVADYFEEVSGGQVAVIGDVRDWYDAGPYSPSWSYEDFENLFTVLDPVIDYSQYDGNGDGAVDAVCFLRSGNGEEDSGDPNDIWSFAMSWVVGWGPWDGMMIHHWNTCPETKPLRNPDNPTEFLGVDTLNNIRVFCHELSHNFGLPDLYDYDKKLDTTTYYKPNDHNDHPLVDWCLMGYGGYGILSLKSINPSHLCGWSKTKLGWIEPITLSGECEDLVLYNIETRLDSSLYLVPIDPAEGEYFLLEFRNPRSTGKFDHLDSDFSTYFWPDLTYGADTLDRGLLITHVHDSLVPIYVSQINNGRPEYPHYTVMVEDAGYNRDRDLTTNPEGRVSDSAQWWYPYETRKAALFSDDVDGQNEFGPYTVPSSDGYYEPTGIYVRVDSIVDDRLYLYVYTNVDPPPCCMIRGDADSSGDFDVADIDFLIAHLYQAGPGPSCLEEADADGVDGLNIADIDYLIDHLYKGGPAPVACP